MNSHESRAVFDVDAEAYDRTRPVCPPELFDDLLRLAGLVPGSRVLEIGCGTGQATLSLAARGLSVTAVELGPRLAAVARRRLAAFPDVAVHSGSFEEWNPPARPFDAVLAVNSLHWVDSSVRYAKPAALLGPGGVLVLGATLRAQANLATQSGTWALGEARAADFLARVRARLESLGRPELAIDFVATLTIGRR